ncbi:MAG: serine protein kinase, partial [Candidatus Sericytochromatia bacterium]
MKSGSDLIAKISQLQDKKKYQELNWEGSFQDYLDIVANNPKVTRNAYQRMYDMIKSYGSNDFYEYKKKITRYHFFDDPIENGRDSVFGIDIHLMKLVRVFRSAALGYGTEKRIILLHGPVGSAKSTIAR